MSHVFKHSSFLRVRYSETDQMGYCYYGNYASFFEVGRVEALRSLGVSYRELEEKGVMLPVRHFSIDYFAPAKYDDLLEIETSIVVLKGAKIIFDYVIYNEAKQKLVAGTTTLVFVNKETMRPIPAPDYMLELFQTKAQ